MKTGSMSTHNPPLAVSSGVGINGHYDSSRGGVSRDSFIQSFEQKLKDVRERAHTIAFLHAVSRFLAFCNLTWATVVLLGSFISSLVARDFAFVVCLLLLEAARLASASFFMCLLTRPLAYHSQDPRNIDHGKDGHYPRSRCARIASYMVQFTLIIPSLVLPTIGQVFLHRYGHEVHNLQNSLRIFYSLVAFNSLVAILNLICSGRAFSSLDKSPFHDQPPEQSILRYFDTVLKNSTSLGLVQADDFEFFRFAYMMLGGEFRRIVQPEAVGKNHRQLIKYMYVHRLGVDFLQIYMEAGDAYVQLAAVNMVGFWADTQWGVGVEAEGIKLPRKVVVSLADKVESTGQVAWAATTSIGILGCSTPQWAKKLERTCNSRGVRLLDHLADIIDDSRNRSLAIVRTLVQLYEQLCVNEQSPPNAFTDAGTTLVPKLRKLAENARVHRLRVQAAYLLLLMGQLSRYEYDRSMVLAITITTDSYWFKSEKEMLGLLLQKYNAPAFMLPLHLRHDKGINPLFWALEYLSLSDTSPTQKGIES